MNKFKNIKNFIFDCDGVLYQDLDAVFGQVSKRMTKYISEKLNLDLKKAKELQTNYFHKYNTSLNGLMIHHKVEPEEFLEYVHDINLDFMQKDLVLREELIKLDARKFVFTNGSNDHVKNIIKHLGIDGLFDGIFDIKDCNLIPKPSLEPYEKLVKKFVLTYTRLSKISASCFLHSNNITSNLISFKSHRLIIFVKISFSISVCPHVITNICTYWNVFKFIRLSCFYIGVLNNSI